MKYLLVLFLFSFTAGGPIDKAGWLIGSWQSNASGRHMLETWVKVNDSTLAGKGQLVKGRDTLLLESVSLEQRGGQLYYVPTVTGQNKGLPVRFALTFIDSRQMVFENPAHDFPQKVSYTLVSPDSLLAEISGVANGVLKTRQFPMQRLR
ncbi:hypothetical protein DLD77_04410 [Chitinophaga alhagiae]|uniref:DUF6265 domain-containing protein n=1 Tax=Chitinophaga alhagiae TaxID=2203219 RepID=A0ABM6WAH7_9BACT|nr:DUF6265 family protein [Chitinophaga alhagiae]AWO00994.1 hypothetical protein DLD77_04410 [Chitinophaga alhagiae]